VPKTPPYPEEFRREAVRLLRRGDRTVPELARDLGCSPQSLRNWSRQADLDAGRRSDGLTSDEREELRRLRREVRTLTEEREILKKAAVFFAKDGGIRSDGQPMRRAGGKVPANAYRPVGVQSVWGT